MKQAVSCILFNPDRTAVLLVKRRDIPVWVLPGGGIDPGETPETAAIREIFEESGFHVVISRKVAEYLPVNRLTQLTHFFECVIVSGKATTSTESSDVRFFQLSALPKLLPPPYPGWIEDAVAAYPHVIRKKITGVSYPILIKYLVLHPILVCRFLLTKIGIHINNSRP